MKMESHVSETSIRLLRTQPIKLGTWDLDMYLQYLKTDNGICYFNEGTISKEQKIASAIFKTLDSFFQPLRRLVSCSLICFVYLT